MPRLLSCARSLRAPKTPYISPVGRGGRPLTGPTMGLLLADSSFNCIGSVMNGHFVLLKSSYRSLQSISCCCCCHCNTQSRHDVITYDGYDFGVYVQHTVLQGDQGTNRNSFRRCNLSKPVDIVHDGH